MMFIEDWVGLSVPFAYIVILVGSLITFSSVYRKRKAAASANLPPWFPPHTPRDIYLSLLHLDPEEESKKVVAIPDSLKRAALLRRALEDIHRVVKIRSAKQACCTLLQRGSVGEDLWSRFLRAESEMEEEIRDVVLEANALQPNWGQTIFQTANEMAANIATRNNLDEIQAKLHSEKEWWDKHREKIQTEFLKELDPEPSNQGRTVNAPSDDDAILVEACGPAANNKGSVRNKKGKN